MAFLTSLVPWSPTQLKGGFADATHFPGVGYGCWKNQSRPCFQIIIVRLDLSLFFLFVCLRCLRKSLSKLPITTLTKDTKRIIWQRIKASHNWFIKTTKQRSQPQKSRITRPKKKKQGLRRGKPDFQCSHNTVHVKTPECMTIYRGKRENNRNGFWRSSNTKL